jgi:hypothetical protein
MELNYELCETCEQSFQNALAEAGTGLSIDQMFEQKEKFSFDLAFIFLREGHYVMRACEEGNPFPNVIGAVEMESSCEEDYHLEIARIKLETNEVVSYVGLSSKDIFADDWTLVKINNLEQENQ